MKNYAGFPMMMAVRTEAINAQLASIFDSSDDLPKSWQLPDASSGDDPGWQLTVDEFGPPQIDFNTQNAGTQACRLILPIVTGSFATYSVDMTTKPPSVTQNTMPLNGVKIFATTPINKVVHSQFSDEEFEVQALYADLEQVGLVDFELSKEIDVAVLGTVKASLQTVIQNKLRDMGKKNPTALLFGNVSIPKLPDCRKALGPLAPRACAHTVVGGDLGWGGGSLFYLLWLDDPSTMPTGSDAGLLNYDWGHYYSQATLLLSDSLFLKQFLIPAMQKQYPGIKFSVTEGDVNNRMNASFAENESEANIKKASSLAQLTDNYGFSASGMNNPTFTKFDMWIPGEAIRIDYEFTFEKPVLSVPTYYKATGQSNIIVTMKDGQLQATVDSNKPKVEELADDIWSEIAKDVIEGLSLGFASWGYLGDQQGALDLGSAFRLSFNSDVSLLPTLFQLPGQAVFTFKGAQLQNGLLIGCEYSTDQSRFSCP